MTDQSEQSLALIVAVFLFSFATIAGFSGDSWTAGIAFVCAGCALLFGGE